MDANLIEEYLNGNEKALEELVSKYLKPVYNFAFRLSQNESDASDITQETFIKAWKNLKRFDKEKKFLTWILTIARNTFIDKSRKKSPLLFGELETNNENYEDNLEDTAELPDEILERNELSEELDKALGELPIKYRDIILLHDGNDLTFEEISEITKEPMNTIKSRYRRGLIILKKILHQN